ncbi:MAG TPA: alpha-amylase family glycosyl hydrolase [Phototrophicaceae bacterium]|jgi:glycosidase|nr:alpha-amylase family glycosyl hydrolase [Phototrophicaceae bacterium]
MLDFQREAKITLNRLLPRLAPLLTDPIEYQIFASRMSRHFPVVFRLLHQLYGDRYDFFFYVEQIIQTTARAFAERSAELQTLDMQREENPHWYASHEMVGGVCYVDLFARNFAGLRTRIPYFKELGLTYLHLMPLFLAPTENSDGGYAISDFRQTNPSLGTMDELRELATELRENGISLVLDFVFNHTSDEHQWAVQALAGDEYYQNYYFLFPDRTLPDQYEKNLREIFPEQAPGNFSYRQEVDKWVWTTFNTFQWDLNYANPEVFNAMLGEMLFLANQGVEVLRLDAVVFIWKQLGTTCENLPPVHWIIQAMNALARIAAPALLFKSEAIVHPDDVASFVRGDESPISYNPTFMALIWEALATREVKLLRHSMSHRFDLGEGCAWVNYVRVHDDIGWSFADEDAAALRINGFSHRIFLNQFYAGQFSGSFASGLPFNYNPITQDMRICGTTASLCGLELALDLQKDLLINHAIRRILMIYSVIMSAGGVPLIYLGDEIATLNDYTYSQNPAKAMDSRWVHRPRFDLERANRRHDLSTPEGQIFSGLKHLVSLRKSTAAFAGNSTLFFDTQNPHVLGFIRNRRVLILANFSEVSQTVNWSILGAYWRLPDPAVDLVMKVRVKTDGALTLEPYQFMWLVTNANPERG